MYGRTLVASRWLCIGAALTFASFCFIAVLSRLFYPYELEWMTGSILDHVERVRAGLPIYAQPSPDWVPFMYPPLYYWICALVTKVLPGFLGCRLVSLAWTGVQAYCVWRLARRSSQSRFWAVLALGLFFA